MTVWEYAGLALSGECMLGTAKKTFSGSTRRSCRPDACNPTLHPDVPHDVPHNRSA